MARKKALAWSPVRDLMKSVGAQVVARDAVVVLIDFLTDQGQALTKKALKIMQNSKRVKLTKEDVALASKM